MHPICDRVHYEKRATLRYLVKFQAQIRHLRSGSQYEAAFGLFCDLFSVGVQPLTQTLTSSQVPVSFRQHSASKSYRAGAILPVLLRQNVAILSQQYRYRAAVALGPHLCKMMCYWFMKANNCLRDFSPFKSKLGRLHPSWRPP